MSGPLQIELVVGEPGSAPLRLSLPAGTTVLQAIEASGLDRAQRSDLQGRVGVFGRLCALDHVLVDGDRVEIYRPLLADPKDARRGRVARDRKAERIAAGG